MSEDDLVSRLRKLMEPKKSSLLFGVGGTRVKSLYELLKSLGYDVTPEQVSSIIQSLDFGTVTSQIDASVIISGVLDLARIPRLDLTKVPQGASGYFLKGAGVGIGDSVYALLTLTDIPVMDLSHIPRLDLTKIPQGVAGYFLKGAGIGVGDSVYALLEVTDIPVLPATKITSDVFDTARIPGLDASKITTGTFDLTRIPAMDDGHIPNLETLSYGGAFATAQIPSLDASKIASGTFDVARIPDLAASKITSGNFSVSRMPLGGDWPLTSQLAIYRASGEFVIGLAEVGPTFKIEHATGNISQVGTVIASGIGNFTGFKNSSPSIASPSRNYNTYYQNTSGKNIMMYARCSTTAGDDLIDLWLSPDGGSTTYAVGSVTLPNGKWVTVSAMVPDGWYYQVASASATLLYVKEQVF